MIRAFAPEDIDKLKVIHEKYYKDQFSFPMFFNNFLCVFSVVNDDKIVLAGGVKTILEAVAITDKSNPVRLRREALYELLHACMFTAARCGYDQIHTTVVNDDKWALQLQRVGFKPVNGQVLVLEV